ncbi:hypothetical protein HN358_04730 [Candidatus Uhrbacteria bacterium]|jgi:hypothetical protein|nr:hypothetical protein [Candidatus Uhrbacteria bacterium]MBT7717088.1 hypothetical protein [Candidatus Uhrbacteria bacterium]
MKLINWLIRLLVDVYLSRRKAQLKYKGKKYSCEHAAKDFAMMVESWYITDEIIDEMWGWFMSNYMSDQNFTNHIKLVITAFEKHRPKLMEQCIPSEGPPTLPQDDFVNDYESEGPPEQLPLG